jgi:hypothetical protein
MNGLKSLKLICSLLIMVTMAKAEARLDLVPWPAVLTRGTGEFILGEKSTIVAPVELNNEALLLAEGSSRFAVGEGLKSS